MLRTELIRRFVLGCVIALSAFGVGCSSNAPDRDAALLDSKPAGELDPDAEAERLRQLQMIRVWRETDDQGQSVGEWMDYEGETGLLFDLAFFCAARFGWGESDPDAGVCARFGDCDSGVTNCTCHQYSCNALISLCMAHTALDLAAPRSGPYRFEWEQFSDQPPLWPSGPMAIEVPSQPLAANAAILRSARDAARSAMWGASRGLLNTSFNCDERVLDMVYQVERDRPDEQPFGELLANTFAEGYRVHDEATAKAVDAIVSVADWQRSHPSLEVQVDRAILGDKLSRAEAVHLLVGGDPGLPPSFEVPGNQTGLCTTPELSGPAQRAIATLREAAMHPEVIVGIGSGSGVPIRELLGDDPRIFVEQTGTVLDRLKALGKIDSGADTDDLLDALDLRAEDFEEARRYMAEEFVAYSRSLAPNVLISAGRPAAYDWFASTGSAAPARETAFYGALARYSLEATLSDIQAPRVLDMNDLYTATSFADVVDASGSVAQEILDFDYTDDEVRDMVRPQMARVVSEALEERIGRWIVCNDEGNGKWYSEAYGFGDPSELIVVRGEEGLQCGVQGLIEGVPCDLDPWILQTLTVNRNRPDFNAGAASEPYGNASELVTDLAPEHRVYLLKPRLPGAPVAAGQYEVLAGAVIPTFATFQRPACARIPVLPEAERRVAKILEPSSKWCTQSKVSCAGEDFDARLPLENELSDDGSGVENSWRKYLDMAKQAAAEADLLGEQFVNLGIELDLREEAVEEREHAQEVAVLQELENLQSICGTSVDVQGLVPDALRTFSGDPCNVPLDCQPGFTCFSGKCVPDIVERIETLAETDPEYRRLLECISPGQDLPFVALGDTPLYAWYVGSDPNTLCLDTDLSPADSPCPVLNAADRILPNNGSGVTPVTIDVTLDYFRSDFRSRPNLDQQTCDDLRTLRDATDDATRAEYLDKIRATNFFHPALMVQIAAAVGWEARMGGYGAVTYNGVSVFETGRFGGGSQSGWPCNAAERPVSCAGAAADTRRFFCAPLGCSENAQNPELPATNQRLRDALVALRLSLGMKLDKIAFPFFMARNYHTARGIPAPMSFTRAGPGNLVISDHIYSDFAKKYPFSPITRQELDAAQRVGWCWGGDPMCPAGTGWVPWTPQDVQDFDFATAALGDFLLDSFREQRKLPHSVIEELVSEIPIIGGPVGSRLGKLHCSIDCPEVVEHFVGDWRQELGTFDGNFWTWADLTRDSLFVRSGNALGWFTTASTPSLGWSTSVKAEKAKEAATLYTGAILEHLTSSPYDLRNLSFIDDLQVGSATHKAEVVQGFTGLQLAEPGLGLRMNEVVDGMELLCEIVADVGAEPSCSTLTAPDIRSAADLAKASDHLQCMARAMEATFGQRVLAHFPADAVDALRRQSAVGSAQQVAGDAGIAISTLRAALVELADTSPQVGAQLEQMANDIDAVRVAIERNGVAKQIAEVEFQSLTTTHLTNCIKAQADLAGLHTIVKPGTVISAAATCVNSFYQIHLGDKLRDLKRQDSNLATEQAVIDFDGRFSERAQTLERLGSRAAAAVEQIDAQLKQIENLRLKARRSLNRVFYMNSFEAGKQMAINNMMRRRFNTAGIRYEKAFKNAQRLAFVAKRAIEQRLGMHLASMQDKLPLVDAPSTWEASVCANQGIDWDRMVEESGTPLNDPADRGTANFAEAYIGDYVRNLENVVESYRMVHNFHEGLDTAVISLKDDVYRSQGTCEVTSGNLLHHSGQLDVWKTASSTVGWRVEGCAVDSQGPLPDCVDALQIAETPAPQVESGSDPVAGYRVIFGPPPLQGQPGDCAGCGVTAGTQIAQEVDLVAGDYLLSWYSRQASPTFAHYPFTARVRATLANGSAAPVVDTGVGSTGTWDRSYQVIRVPSDQLVKIAITPGAITGQTPLAPTAYTPHEVEVGAIMLEHARTTPSLFANTGESRTRMDSACADTNGAVFRGRFKHGCVRLCANGFDGECEGEDASEHCYREAHLNLNQRDIESGRLLGNTGFALGNFNYRIESVSVNFVGTGIRDCAESPTPASCNARGFIPYSLVHAGPYFVRNHMGQDFKAELFTGHIEHARGLGSERYITNPISSADAELLGPYTRQEFQGRPLDGNFTLRVWEDEGIEFNKIEDVQVILHYRYWTRFD